MDFPYTVVRPEYPTPPQLSFHSREQSNEISDYISPTIDPASLNSDYGLSSYSPSLSPSPFPEPLCELTDNLVVSISTSFHPKTTPSPDTIILSSDGVLFYQHSPTLLSLCPEVFKSYLHAPLSSAESRKAGLHLDAPASQLNIILHTLHGTSPAANSPGIDTLVAAIDRMPGYGISPPQYIRPTTPIHELLLSFAPLRPLDVYALGAHHNIPSIAVGTSSHLLSYNLAAITDEMAERIGAVYLKKLMLLHVGRYHSLRDILLQPPRPHPATKGCSFEDQRRLTRAWALVSAYLVWDAKPDLSTYTIKSTLNPLLENIDCKMCYQSLQGRIKDVVGQWALVKHAI